MLRNIAPGYCIVEKPGTLDFQASQLFRDTRSPAARLFMQNNADTPWLNPGQILILVDPVTPAPWQILRTLRQAKQKTNAAFIGVNSAEAGFLHQHFDLIAGLTSSGDKIFGVTSDLGEKYFSKIEVILKRIEESYQNQYQSQATLISQQFFIERNQLLSHLKEMVSKPLLKSLARYSIKLKPYDDMRKALNLSSRSIIHEWSTVGIGSIPGYSNYVGNAARAARFMKYGGYIGIIFSFAGTTNKVIDGCTLGRENECAKIAFKEYTKFSSNTFASMTSGTIGAAMGLGICTGISITTAGLGGVACAALGSIAGGTLGASASDYLMNLWLK